jgi:hypothetical protein
LAFGLWSSVSSAGAADDSNILKTTLGLVFPFLSEGAIIAGQFVRDDEFHATPFDGYEFHQWTMPPREAIAKIEAGWRELGRDPNTREIVWFTAAVGNSKWPTTKTLVRSE